MATEVGEYLVGAYLKLIEGCDFVDYNVRPPGGGLAGLEELDVVGFRFETSTAYLCEVTTHIRGLLYGDNRRTIQRIKRKYKRQQEYAGKHLQQFQHHVFMFWSPVVPEGYLTAHLAQIDGLQLVINCEYKRRTNQLLERARKEKHDTGNPVFRVFQILGSLRD
jgi:hypothetical protein